MPPVSPIQAVAAALVVAIGNAVVSFGAFNNTVASSVESAVIGAIALGFVIANALHHSANARVTAATAAHLSALPTAAQNPAPSVTPAP